MNTHKKNSRGPVILGMLALIVSGSLALSGCEKEGPAEKAGKEIDNALSNADSKIQSVGKEIEKAVN